MTTSGSDVRRLRSTGVGIFLLAGTFLSVSCGGSDAPGSSSPAGVVPSGVSVSKAWARTSPMSTSVGAVYATISSSVDDELVGVSVDPWIAARAEIHETVSAELPGEQGEDSSMPHGTKSSDSMTGQMSGQMTMAPIAALPIPAGTSVTMEPGGYHIMLFDLVGPLETGRTFQIVLTFAQAGAVTVSVDVRDEAP